MTVLAAVRRRMETLRTLFREAPKEARTYLGQWRLMQRAAGAT
ncbi:hypothetical protein ACVFYP_22410 [Roseomonas sp. F4]